MNIKSLLTGFLIITFSYHGFGQKIKYKDLFVLLNAKQYAEAEPYLKKYLKVNDDEPNAYLFMGIIYQEKASKFDMLKQTEALVIQLDSAVYFYEKASKGMTEKEVSRNEEYYQMYNRRDLRTGKFGVKLSDVQLDIETRLKLKEKAKQIQLMKSQFVAAETYYSNSVKSFQQIQKQYPSQKEFYLRADDKLLAALAHLTQVYDSCHMSFNDYKATSQGIGKTGYNQDFDPVEIIDFKKDGTTSADFFQDDLKIWDYRRWALGCREVIEKEMIPLGEQLVGIDVEINALAQKLKKDSVSVHQEVAQLRTKVSFPALKKIDPHPLPLGVFEMKIAELDYGSQIILDRPLKDSLNVGVQIAGLKKELAMAGKIDSLSGQLLDRNLDEEMVNYNHFVTTAYSTPVVLHSLIKSTKEFALREVKRKGEELTKKNNALRWILNGKDSIPVFTEVSPKSRFKPLLLQEGKFTAGLQYADSIPSGYFYIVNPSRKPEGAANFQVDKQAFRKRNLPFVKALSVQDEKGLVYFLVFYSETKIKDKYPATVTKIYKQEGLSWSINYAFSQLPYELIFSTDTFELTIKTKTSIGEVFPVIFDKAGKVVR